MRKTLVLALSVFIMVAYAADYTETAYDINMKMIWVEGGDFLMGCTSEQGSDCKDDEKNVRRVTVDGFYMGMFEVTMSQWEKVMGTSIYDQQSIAELYWSVIRGFERDFYFAVIRGEGLDYAYISPCPIWGEQPEAPIYYVSWKEAMEFCNRLSDKTGKTYTLPTEAQWEYAARGGKKADGTKYAGSNVIDDVAWYSDDGLGNYQHVCGSKRANALGIYDMSGNVREWCKDWYSDSYNSHDTYNPTGPSSGSECVVRGGSCRSDSSACRVSCRGRNDPQVRDLSSGFRVVCIP